MPVKVKVKATGVPSGWTQQQRVEYAGATQVGKRRPKGRRKLPRHVIELLMSPDTDTVEIPPHPGLDPDEYFAIPERQMVEVVVPKGPHFYCQICKRPWKLEALRLWKRDSLEPEWMVCCFCWKDHDLESRGPRPKKSPAQPQPERVATPLATAYDEQGWVVAEVLARRFPDQLEAIDAYVEESMVVVHGQTYLVRFFDKKGRLNTDKLVEDFQVFTEME